MPRQRLKLFAWCVQVISSQQIRAAHCHYASLAREKVPLRQYVVAQLRSKSIETRSNIATILRWSLPLSPRMGQFEGEERSQWHQKTAIKQMIFAPLPVLL
jgi:hypothetical protein